MARGEGKGGYQRPTRPAAVAGPGALSQRTDGGPAQPVRVPTGGEYGQAKALREQQQAAPLPDRTTAAPTPGAQSSPASPPVDVAGASVFAPTDRPGESPLAGSVPVGSAPTTDPDTIVRLLYSAFPHPQFLRLIRRV